MIASGPDEGWIVRRLGGKVAIVTGSARGIGRAIALRLASEGAAVALVDRAPEGTAETASEIRDLGGQAQAYVADVTDRGGVREVVSNIATLFGSIDILVNNAGMGRPAMFTETTDADWNEIVGVNLGGTFVVSQETVRHMLRQSSGRIVNIASLAAHTANDGQTAYAAAKAGVVAMTRAMAFELARHGIAVNAISPGPIDTELARKMLTQSARRAREERIPQGRLGTPDDVAAAAAFLASADAAFINGEVLVVDGGLLIAGIKAE